jgi:signal peptidase II
LLAGVGIVAIAGDQVTKAIARNNLQLGELHSYLGDTVRVQLAHNYGAFLSLGDSLPENWRQALWSVGVGIVLIAILGYALFAKSLDRPLLWALALVFAGGASNLYDRLSYGGYVVDFLNVGIGRLRTGIFNVADMGITTGALLVLWSAFFGQSAAKKR